MDPMDSSPSPRRELQGPRPSPLKVSRDSHKIKKPSSAPPHHHSAESLPPPPPPPAEHHQRDPVVIYSISPKIIHATLSEFMTLVQRLTGPDSADEPSMPSPGGALSPAARIASFEKAAASPDGGWARASVADQLEIYDDGVSALDRLALFPGILSPVPASLPPISPNLFSPSFDLSFLFELSPAVDNKNSSSRGFLDGGSLWGSPNSNLLLTPTIPSPGACWELLSQPPDL